MADPTPGDLSARHVEVLREYVGRYAGQIDNRGEYSSDLHTRALEAIAALSALPAAGGERTPDGYHYVYLDPFGSGEEVIVHNSGGEWNGQKPRHALPYYYTTPQPSAAEGVALLPREMGQADCPHKGAYSFRDGWAIGWNDCIAEVKRIKDAAVGAQGDGWLAVMDALDLVNAAANDARHRGEYDKANKLVKARITLYRAARANEESAAPAAGKGVDFWTLEHACAACYGGEMWAAMAPDDKRAARERIQAALTRQPVAGDGMVLVPKELTREMFSAGFRQQYGVSEPDPPGGYFDIFNDWYKAMIAAAPAATPTDGGEGKAHD